MLFMAVAILFSSCSGGSSKFEGEWIPKKQAEQAMASGIRMLIKKEGEQFKLYQVKDGKELDVEPSLFFYYDKGKDILTNTVGNETVDVVYDKQNKSIKFISKGGSSMYGDDTMEMIRPK